MLGKLFKYEFRNTAKIMLTLYSVLAAVTILGMIAFSIPAMASANANTVFLFFGAGFIILYVFTIIAFVTVTYVYICIYFYKSMYSDQGYLTHTLPVSPVATLNVKIVVSLFWLYISVLLAIVSVLLLLIAASRGKILTEFSGLNFSEINLMVQAEFGISIGAFIVGMIVMSILSCLSFIMLVFTSASIGQLFNQHKWAAAIIAGIVLYFVRQISSFVPILVTSIGYLVGSDTSGTSVSTDTIPANILITMIVSFVILWAFFIVAYYIVCHRIVKKHINLD